MAIYDFLLNSRGDLDFETIPPNEAEQLEFNFHVATSDSLLFNFYTMINGEAERKPGMFQYDFYIYQVCNNKLNKLITGDEYIRQAIRIQLETERNTLRENASVGSDMYKYRHNLLNEEKIISQIENSVYEAIKDIVPNSEVKVYLKNTAYYDFHDAIKISITFLDKIMWFTL